MCLLLPRIQRKSAELKQYDDSRKILSEVCKTLDENNKIIENSEIEFNILNQTNVNTVADYLINKNVLSEYETKNETILEKQQELNKLFIDINNQIGSFGTAIIDNTGLVIISNDFDLMGKSLLDYGMTFNDLFRLTDNDGTFEIVDGETIYKPLVADGYYSYTKLLGEAENTKYFLLVSQNSSILDRTQLASKEVSRVLESMSVGETGFVFAVDKKTGEFLHFKNKDFDLSGQKYEDYGVNDEMLKNDYQGYQVINGMDLYCVSKEYQSEELGDYIFFTAVLSKDEIARKNINSVAISSLAFVLVALTVIGFGIILRRDYLENVINVENNIFREIESESNEFDKHLTHEEIKERVKIVFDETVEKNQEPKLRRKLVGTRDIRGRQHYILKYVFSKMLPTMIMGILIIFLITFFSQTLISLDSVTKSSKNKVNDISRIIEDNEAKKENIQSYLDQQYLSKNKIISYLLQEDIDFLDFDSKNDNVHALFKYDENGEKVDVYDKYNNQMFAIANSEKLKEICKNNNIDSIYIFHETGNVIATSTENWNFKLSTDVNAQSYPFNEVLNGEREYYIQEAMESEKEKKYEQFFGYNFYYYTYKDLDADGNQVYKFASKSEYEADLKNGTNKITRYKSLLQIGINQENMNHLLDSTSVNYILSNMHIYGTNSFYLAFDKTEKHNVMYAPVIDIKDKTAEDIGFKNEMFVMGGTYNGFTKVNGENYYITVNEIGDYYIATAIPEKNMYESRNQIALYTLLFSSIFIIFASGFFTVTTDKADEEELYLLREKPIKRRKKNSFILSTPVGNKKTVSAASRYYKIAWQNKTPEQKLSGIIFFYLTVASIIIIAAIVLGMASERTTSIINYIFTNEWERGINIFAIVESLLVFIMALSLTKLLSICVKSFSKTLGARAETTGNLIMAMIKFVAIIAAIFYCLYLFGFNTASLLTSAGILSLVIGLGAQSLISDILAGIFIVFEGEFRVGDIVTIDGFRGQVLEIGLRTTKIMDTAKNIKIFNNRNISGVLNMTKEASVAKIIVGIEYQESIERVEAILKKELPLIKKRISKIIDGPIYKGVAELGESSVKLLIVATCSEQNRMQLEKDLNREIFIIFNKYNINIPFQQITISGFEKNSVEATKNEKLEANLFNKEEKEEIRNMEKEE